MEYLPHKTYILHGDMKSYNILISRDYSLIKICHFRVSVPLSKNLKIDISAGDYTYIGIECKNAPEIVSCTVWFPLI